jgi:hypothetical protein
MVWAILVGPLKAVECAKIPLKIWGFVVVGLTKVIAFVRVSILKLKNYQFRAAKLVY